MAAGPGLMGDRTYVGAHFRASDAWHDLSKEFNKNLALSPGVRDLFLGLPTSLNAKGIPVTPTNAPIFGVNGTKVEVNDEIDTVRSILISSQDPVIHSFKQFEIGNLTDKQRLKTHGIDESGKYTEYNYTVASLEVSDQADEAPAKGVDEFARVFGIDTPGQTVNIMIDACPIAINELISKLTPVDGFTLNVNLVVNREAVNDPATRPCELKEPGGGHVRCDTLYDSGQSNIIYSEKDPFFTKYTITMGRLDIGKEPKHLKALKCKVEINYGEKETHISLNPKKDNSIDTCLKFIKGLFSAVYDLFRRKRISVAYTQKASGDAGEAMSALDDTREYTSLKTRKRHTLKTVGGRVFIVTHDRILLAFCLYIGVNVLFCHNIGGVKTLYGIFRAIEISAEEKLARLVGQYEEAKGSVDRWKEYVEMYDGAVKAILGGLMGEAEAKYGVIDGIRPKSITNPKYATVIIEWLKDLWKIKGLRYIQLGGDLAEFINLIDKVDKNKDMTTEKATMMTRVIGIHTMFLTVSTKFPKGPDNPEPKAYNTDKNYVLMINPLMLIKEEYRESESDTPIYRCTEIFNALREGINTYERYGISFEKNVLPKIGAIYGELEDPENIKDKTLLYNMYNLFGRGRPINERAEAVALEEEANAAAANAAAANAAEENAEEKIYGKLKVLKVLLEAEAAAAGGGGGGGPREDDELDRAIKVMLEYDESAEVIEQRQAAIDESRAIVKSGEAFIDRKLEGEMENVAQRLLDIKRDIEREGIISRMELPYSFTRCDISSLLYYSAHNIWKTFLDGSSPAGMKRSRGGANEAYEFLSKMYILELYKTFQEIDINHSFDTGYYVHLSAAVLACLELYENPIDRVHCFYYLLPNVETGAGFLARYVALTTLDLATYDEKMPELPKMAEINMEEIIENARSLMDTSPEHLLKELYKVIKPKVSPKVPRSVLRRGVFSPPRLSRREGRAKSPITRRLEFGGAQVPKKTRRKRKGRRQSTKRHAPK